ncbi:MAG: Wzz/FepE/Etk N-terminal domain-containing protein [Planctomycetota bacterium]
MNEQPTSPISAGDFWEVVFRHKKKIVILPTLLLLMAIGIILWAPRAYQSEAKLLLQIGRESVGISPTATTGQTISLQQTGRDAEVVSAIELISSRGVIAQVVDELGPEYILRGGPAGTGDDSSPIVEKLKAPLVALIKTLKSIDPVSDREEAIIQLEKSLTLDSERDSTIVVAQMEAESPRGAQAILAKLIDVYQREHLRVHRNPESGAFFAEQSEVLEERLAKANENVRAAKNRMGLASVEGRRSTLEQQLNLVEQASYDAEQQLATAAARAADLRAQLTEMPERMIASRRSIPNEGADLLRDQLFELQRQKLDLAARLQDNHPQFLAISAQVEEARKVVEQQTSEREETTNDVNPNHRALSLELKQQQSAMAGHEARLETLRDQKKLILSDLKQLNHDEVELDELDREVAVARTKFFKYAENLEQARIDAALEEQKISSVSLAQAATLSEKPVSPSKAIVGLGAMVLAFGGVVTWVAASEHLNDRVRSADDTQKQTGLPVFAEIPKSTLHGRALNYQ